MFRRFFTTGLLTLAMAVGFGTFGWAASAPTDQAVQTALQQELSKKFKDVHVRVDDRVATMNGTVDRYLDKLSAEKTAKKYEALTRVVDRIRVAGPAVPDEQLLSHLSRELANDRSLQNNVFDSYSLAVNNGVVTVVGYAHNYTARDSALGIVAAETGVKGVVNKIAVLPLSSFDDRIRLTAANRIYGDPALQKYALNPEHPIRIIVNDGNVILDGTVLSPMDKELAEIAALQVPGVFSVTNMLQVEQQGSRESKSAD